MPQTPQSFEAERQRLVAGASTLGVALDEAQLDRFVAYLDLLERWNATYNLTAVRERAAMVVRHLLDSLAVVPHVGEARVADLGTGAGLPGIPLTIARPQAVVTLVESNGKKARFLREVQRRLALPNLRVVEDRAESAAADGAQDATIARALASVDRLCAWSRGWLAPGGRLYAMKGPGLDAELAALPEGWALERVLPLAVPGLAEARSLAVLRLLP